MSNSLPEILISDHGRQRLKERVHVSDRKIVRLVQKAWNSKSQNIPKLKQVEYNTFNKHGFADRVHREMMGYIFIFAMSPPLYPGHVEVTLITVI